MMSRLHSIAVLSKQNSFLILVMSCVLAIPGLAISRTWVEASQAGGRSPLANSSREAFDQFKKLEGKWRGRSTNGWEEVINYKTIAKGSVVVANSFDAHPNESMMTMFYLDGDRLMLTHFCVAGNQPRLVATSFEDGGKAIIFTFLDGTNLPSRDQGHMDKLVFRFIDEKRAVSRWTWCQDGKETWMEEIALERIPSQATGQ